MNIEFVKQGKTGFEVRPTYSSEEEAKMLDKSATAGEISSIPPTDEELASRRNPTRKYKNYYGQIIGGSSTPPRKGESLNSSRRTRQIGIT